MATQYTSVLKLALPTQGELSGAWGNVVNDNITSMIEQAIAGLAVINTWSSNSHTLTSANGVTSESRCAMLSLVNAGSAPSAAASVICPALAKTYIVKNGSGQAATLKTSSGTGIAVPNGKSMLLFCDGTNVVEAVDHVVTMSAGTLTITGLTTFASLKGADSTTVTGILDEDNMASNSAVKLATQQSIKAYVDSQVDTVDSLAEVLAQGNTSGGTDIAVSTDDKVQFRDAAIHISSSADGQLDIVADTEIQIAATTVDINGAVALNGAITGATNITLSGELDAATGDFSGAVDIDGALDVAGTTNLDVVDIDGAVDMATTLQVDGVATFTGRDVHSGGITIANAGQIGSVGDTDAIAIASDGVVTLTQKLVGTELDISGDVDVDGTTNLDIVDIDGATQIDATLSVGVDDTGYDVKFFGATSGKSLLWDESADSLIVTGTIDATTVEFDALSGTGSVTVTDILDEDNMASNSATVLATQQSIKAYVDAQVDTVDTLAEILAIGNTTTTDQKIQFRDTGIFINSSADGQLDIVADTEIQIAATTVDINGAINASGEIIAASLDISGDIDVDGTTNLDVVDIDGAVDMASTLTVAGASTFANFTSNGLDDNATSTAITIDSSQNVTLGVPNSVGLSGATLELTLGDTGNTANDGYGIGFVHNTSDLNAYILGQKQEMTVGTVGNTPVKIVTNNTPRLTISGTGAATFTGAITANAGVVVDNFTLDGTTLALSSGDLTLDSAGDIVLDADGADIQLKDAGVATGRLGLENGDLNIASMRQDYDIKFKGMDGNTTPFTALTLDMSDGGEAYFVKNIHATSAFLTKTNNDPNLTLITTDADANAGPYLNMFRNSASPADGDAVGLIEFKGKNDAGTTVRYAGIDTRIADASDGTEDGRMELLTTLAGSGGISRLYMDATETVINDNSKDLDFRVESDGNQNMLFVNGEFNTVGIGNPTYSADHQLHILASDAVPSASLLLQSDDTANATSTLKMFARDGSNNNKVTTLVNSAGSLIVGTNDGTERMRISTAGDVIIGTSGVVRRDLGSATSPTLSLEGTFPAINFRDNSGGGCFLGVDGSTVYVGGNGSTSIMNMYVDASVSASFIEAGGITFNGDTATANALNDYEEGTWTPLLSDGTNTNASYATQVGTYTKIGNSVHVQGRLTTTALGSVSGDVQIAGLPFNSANVSEAYTTASFGYAAGLNISAGVAVTGTIQANVPRIAMRTWDAATGTTNMTQAEWSADGDIIFSAEYTAA